MGWGAQSGHMRAGIGWRTDGYDTNTPAINVYIDFYVASVGWGYNDNQVLSYGGSRAGSFSYNMSSPSGGSVERYVGTAVIEGQGQNYSGGPVYSASCQVSGAYDGSAPSYAENFALPARPANVPTPPGMGVDSVTVNSARVVVVASDGRGSGVDWYGAWVTTNNAAPGAGGNVVSSAAGGTFYATGLSAVTTYYAWAQAHNGVGYSGMSGPVVFTTGGNPPSTPAAPGVGTLTASGATVTWAAPANGGSAITGYELQFADDAAFTTGLQNYTVGNVLSYVYTGSSTGTRRYVKVRAINGVGPSLYSTGVGFNTTQTIPTITSPTPGSTRTDGQASATVTAPGLRTNRLLRVQWSKDSAFTNSWETIEMVVSPVAPNANHSYNVVSPTEYLGTGVWYLRARIENSELSQTTVWTTTITFNESHAPTVVQGGPLGGTFLTYGTGAVNFTFTPVDSAPTDTMSAYELIIERADTGAVVIDTGKVLTTFPNGVPKTVSQTIPSTYKDLQLRWRVAVWDANDTAGAFSINAIFYMVDAPTVTMTSPVSPVSVGSPTVTWTFAATLGRYQARADVRIVQTESGQVAFADSTTSSTVRSMTPASSILINGKNYFAEVKVTDSVGKVTTVTTPFVASFNPPAILRYDVSSPDIDNLGYVLVDWSNATADSQLVAWRVYRRPTDSTVWERIAEYTDQTIKQHKDFLVKSYETYVYSVTQVANRFGTNLESAVGLVIKQNTLPTRTNLAKNPTFEGTSPTFAVRTNYAGTPDGRTYVTANGASVGWSNTRSFGTTGAGTYTSVTGATDGPIPTITGYARKTWTTAATGTGYGFETNQMTSPNNGTFYTVSAWIRSNTARSNVGFKIELRDATGVYKTSSFATQSIAAKVWTRVSAAIFVSQALTVKFILDVDGTPLPAVADYIDVTGLLIEKGSTDRGAVQRTNRHLNPSVGRALTNYTLQLQGGTFTSTSTREVAWGSTTATPPVATATWVKVLSTSASTATQTQIVTNATGTGGCPVTAAQSYTFSTYVVSSFIGWASVSLSVTWFNSSGAFISTDASGGSTYTTANAWQRVSKTITSPAGAAFAQVTVSFNGPGLPSGGYFGVTGNLVEQSATLGTYFDGTSFGNIAVEYDFSATLFASTSTARTTSTAVVREYFDGGTAVAAKVNLVQNPSAEVNVSQYSVLSCTIARSTTQWFTGVASIAVTATSTGVNGQVSSSTAIPVVPGRSYVASGYVRAATLPRNVSIIIQFKDENGAFLTPGGLGSQVTSVTDGWTRFTSPARVAPANAVSVVFTVFLATATVNGDVQYLDGMMIEDSTDTTRTDPSSYFDGSTAAANLPDGFKAGYKANWLGTAGNSISYISDADLTPTWTGTAWASVGQLVGMSVAPDTGYDYNPIIQSTRWAKNAGGKSARLMSGWYGYTGGVFAPLDYGTMGGMTAGKTYSMTLSMYVEKPLVGTLDPLARTVEFWAYYSGGNHLLAGATAPNETGVYDFQLSWTLPSDTTSVYMEVHNGSDIDSGDVWIDWLLIEESTVPGPYFDGSYTPDPATLAASWNGTAHNSTSTLGEIPYVEEYRVLEIFHEYYWIVCPDVPELSIALPGTKADDNTLDFEDATYNIIGRGRHRDYGDRLGYTGSLSVSVRGVDPVSPMRAAIEKLREAQETYYLRTPFGKLFPVALGNIGWSPLPGVGKAEMGEITIPYEEVS